MCGQQQLGEMSTYLISISFICDEIFLIIDIVGGNVSEGRKGACSFIEKNREKGGMCVSWKSCERSIRGATQSPCSLPPAQLVAIDEVVDMRGARNAHMLLRSRSAT